MADSFKFDLSKPLTHYVIVGWSTPLPAKTSREMKPQAETVPSNYGFGNCEFDPMDPHMPHIAIAHRDGIDGICAWVEWRQRGQQSGYWDNEKEQRYQMARQAEIAYWKEFMTPNARFSAAWIAKELAYLWTFPLRLGRQWNASTIELAVQELGLGTLR